MRGATCQLQSFLVYFAQLCRSTWSSLEISTFVVDRVCQREVQSVLKSKDRTQSGRKGQALSRTEGRNRQAGSKARCYSQVIRDCWAMGVVNINVEVGRASTAWRSSKIKLRKV